MRLAPDGHAAFEKFIRSVPHPTLWESRRDIRGQLLGAIFVGTLAILVWAVIDAFWRIVA
jgi:hypothetical protein